MFVSTWPSLSPLLAVQSESTSVRPFPFYARNKTYGYLARGLIYHLVRALGLKKDETVLVPDYHHGNEVRAIRAAGANVRFYRIQRDLTPDLDDLHRQIGPDVRVLFVIHYIGWAQRMEELTAIARAHQLTVIEDCALSLFAERDGRPAGTFGDHAIFCLYKTLPVPNGAVLVQNGKPLEALSNLQLTPCDLTSTAGRTLELALETLETHAERTGKMLLALKHTVGNALNAARVERAPVGDAGFSHSRAKLDISTLSLRIMERIDFEEIPEKRRMHFAQLADRLRGRVTFLEKTADAGSCPLFFPLLVRDKRAAVRALMQVGIGAVEFWNKGDPEVDEGRSKDARFLRDHVIELPIHQDVTPAQIDYTADMVLALDLGLDTGPRRAPQTSVPPMVLREAG